VFVIEFPLRGVVVVEAGDVKVIRVFIKKMSIEVLSLFDEVGGLSNMLHEIKDTAGVTIFVVIPSNDLDKVVI
jgi:hypothetical protein